MRRGEEQTKERGSNYSPSLSRFQPLALPSNDISSLLGMGRSFSVTRFGEISPLWQNFTSLREILDGLFLIWQNVEPSLANLLHYVQG